MNVLSKVKPICEHCRVVRINGRVMLVHRGPRKCQR